MSCEKLLTVKPFIWETTQKKKKKKKNTAEYSKHPQLKCDSIFRETDDGYVYL